MSQVIEAKVPDIGDYHDVPVIDICVAVGDTIKVDDALVTLESDKATMDVPSSVAGVVKEVRVKLGDKVSEGAVVVLIETGAAVSTAAPAAAVATTAAPAASVAPPPQAAAAISGNADIECEMLVLGAGPGGYSAAFRSADLGMKTVLVERYATLGGVCLNVGCIPSKALLHISGVMEEAEHMADCGVSFAAPTIDLDKLRAHKDKVVGKLTGGLAGMAKGRKVEVVRGVGQFLDPSHVEVALADGGKKIVRFQKAIIAAGSQAVALPFMPNDDPRVVDSTGALELRQIPKRMLVIGGGIIGLEMASVYSALGSRITVVELGSVLMPGADRDLVKVWEKKNAHRFDRILLNTGVVASTASSEGIEVTYSNDEKESFDLVLVAVGRSPNGRKLAAEKAGVAVSDRGFIAVDTQQRTNVPHIFAVGDIVGQPMLAHKGVHEAHVAAEAANGSKRCFDALQIPSVAYTDPEIAWAGKTEEQCRAEGIKFGKSVFPWAASGRALANGREEGFTKLIFDEETHRLIGGSIVGTEAGDLIGEICLAIEMGCDATDIGHTIHPHPTLGESVGMAAEVYEGVCTDLPAMKKK
ncbi:MAG: Dihydrolipoyl dehydrogenase [Candidatus Accumulibacter regalis]|jgi:dihydrolipoamide dehydrogenase|uniref:Dihydrolipoyl dehydrogenase n=4 Tax=Candidatus Accumulibacter TaxID=327159 RepID=A0A011QBI0_ACCRE|nr:dihydrolipoyl dehydrogenase [Accumulibacter sp.]EXI86587.1 MAG: Dihydrolipoyl dehydrogenase [Candidatus Accumulibacter regalis]MQM34136.1 dihydrolipoyl dehydrogenase [Candidatus Accumulibacter phosphatis]MBN8513421.1 dihydrolipoyl dehydrogenase [Accumulibacter sp.]MBO3703089.1 dihydrolipoyl dehydrogenase [Accumulibacter sp.]HRE72987.1 dihydrolipoyl dehydrogenase [Accumulibacter sp.]